ncbi:MAG: pyroglutamyl-peptidase I [Hyphomicrobiales bacterium]
MAGILLTGFSAFPGAPVNPTGTLVEGLAGIAARRGLDVATAILPTEYAAVDACLPHLLAEPKVILHFGLARKARAMRLERRATNHLATWRPDAAGRTPPGPAIEPRGPQARPATLPVAPALARLRQRGLDATASIDAGDYLCNYLLYRSLALTREQGRIVGFVHIPLPAELRASRRGNAPAMATMISAAAVVLDVALAAAKAA